MSFSISNEIYPSYNAAMLLYRPILIHILKEKGYEDFKEYSYSHTIKTLCSNYDIGNSLRDRMYMMKDFVNKINHQCEIVLDEDRELVNHAWIIVKELVEILF